MKQFVPALLILAMACGKSKDDDSVKPGTADAEAQRNWGIWRTEWIKVADNNGGGTVIVEFEIGDGFVAESKICDRGNGTKPYLVTQRVPAVIRADGYQMLKEIDKNGPQWTFGEGGIVSCGIYQEKDRAYKVTISDEKGLEILGDNAFLQTYPIRSDKRLVDEYKDVELIQ